MEYILKLRKKISELKEEASAVLDKATSEERALTDEETQNFDKLHTEASSLKETEKRYVTQNGLEDELRAYQTGAIASDPEPVPADKRFASFGEQLQAIVRASTPGGSMDNRLISPTAEERTILGLNEQVPSQGGFLVQQDFATELFTKIHETGVLLNRVQRTPIGPNFNGIKRNAIDETDRANGSRWGGIQAFWTGEGQTKAASKPKFRQMKLELEKLTGLYYATDEELADAVALTATVSRGFTEEMGFKADDAIYNGNGAGQPLGILNSNALVTVTKETNQAADTILFENIQKIWARMWARSRANAVWLINQDVEPQLNSMTLPVGTGGIPVYLPANGLSGSPLAVLMGRPVLPIEQASTVGDLGDIMLADLSQYEIIEKGGIQSASSIHVQFLTDQTVFRFVMRLNGQPLWDNVLTPFKGTNTLSPFVTLQAR